MLAGAAVIWRQDWAKLPDRPTHMAGWQRMITVGWEPNLICLLNCLQVVSPEGGLRLRPLIRWLTSHRTIIPREPGRRCSTFYDPVLEFTHHRFFWTLWNRAITCSSRFKRQRHRAHRSVGKVSKNFEDTSLKSPQPAW